MLNLNQKGTNLLPLIQLCLYCGLSMLPGRTLSFDQKDSFQEELTEEQRSNEAPGELTKMDASMHDRAQGGTNVLQALKDSWPAARLCHQPCLGARLPMLTRTTVRRACVTRCKRFCGNSFRYPSFYCFSSQERTFRDILLGFHQSLSFISFGLNSSRLKIV